MHSSRMRAASPLPYWGFPFRGVSVGVFSVQWGLCPRGSLPRGVSLTETSLDEDPPPPDRDQDSSPCGQIDTCENITFANFVCGR